MWVIALVALIIAGFAIPRLGRILVRTAIGGFALLILLGGGLGIVRYVGNTMAASRATAFMARRSLDVDDVSLVETPSHDFDHGFILTGRIRNKDLRDTITTVRLQLDAMDCRRGPPVGGSRSGEQSACEKIGQGNAVISIAIPPGEARDVTETVYLPAMQPRGHLEWNYHVVNVSLR